MSCGKRPADELYDLQKDPHQINNVAGKPEYAAILKSLKEKLIKNLEETKDPRIAGVILTGPPGNLFKWNVRAFGLETATRVLRRAQQLQDKGRGDEWMVINLGPLGKTLYTANHVVSLRGPQTRSDPFSNIGRISKPVLIVHGLADRLAEPKVADQLQKSAGAVGLVKVSKIAGADHRFRGNEATLVEVVHQWILQQLRQ